MKTLSKYEFARLIGARALQLSLGAPPTIKIQDSTIDPLNIARKEFEEKTIPLSVI
ncbi:MAG: DNA-directed RNA polymerase subunit K [Candidatus ainarchaeum sp.]|nr:DNA-directed RNA polymerase subunit K [Candidatus ainarchaeum sp.]